MRSQPSSASSRERDQSESGMRIPAASDTAGATATVVTQSTRPPSFAARARGWWQHVGESRIRIWVVVMAFGAIIGSAALSGRLQSPSRLVDDVLQASRLNGYDGNVRLPAHRLDALPSDQSRPTQRGDEGWESLWDVAIVKIDERSYQMLDGYPFTPEEDARVLRTLAAFGATAIAYDRLLSERRRKIVGPEGIEPLADAIADIRGLPAAADPVDPRDIGSAPDPPGEGGGSGGVRVRTVLASQMTPNMRAVETGPLPELQQVAVRGYINPSLEDGRVIRRYQYRAGDEFSLALASYLVSLQRDPSVDVAAAHQQLMQPGQGNSGIVGNSYREPYLTSEPDRRLLNYYARPGEAFIHASYGDIYRAWPLARISQLGASLEDSGEALLGDDMDRAWSEVAAAMRERGLDRPQLDDINRLDPWLAAAGELAGGDGDVAFAADEVLFLLEDALAYAEDALSRVATVEAEIAVERSAVVEQLIRRRDEMRAAYRSVPNIRRGEDDALPFFDPSVPARNAVGTLAPELLTPLWQRLEEILQDPALRPGPKLTLTELRHQVEHLQFLDEQIDRLASYPNVGTHPLETELRRKLNGKVALIGEWTLTSQDLYESPVGLSAEGGRMYGVEVHATALQNLFELLDRSATERTQQGLRRADEDTRLLITIVVAAVACTIAIFLQSFPGLVALLFGGWLWWMYVQQEVITSWTLLPVVEPGVGILLAFILINVTKVLTVDEERRQVENLFKNYTDNRLVEMLMRDPDRVQLGGEQREITAFFSDIAGFSAIGEKLSAEELVALMNEYLGAMTQVVLDYDGTVDKYIGDAVMAFWNAPLEVDDHAAKACWTALVQRERLAVLNQTWAERGLPRVDIRIGINTGRMVHGNMGSDLKKNYTVMGDEVNLAARLEPLNKEFGTRIIIGEETWKQAEDRIDWRWLGRVRVKGRERPIRFFELVSRKGETTGLDREVISIFHAGLEAYAKADFPRARSRFAKVLELRPDDGPARTYLDLVTQYESDPPPEKGWHGVYEQRSK